jgi:hypothetical protein
MREITLQFTFIAQLDLLENDHGLSVETQYLNPRRIGNCMLMFDPIEEHNPIDTEDTVLRIFGSAIKRILFPNTPYNIEFICQFDNHFKQGLTHNGQVILSSIV